MIRIIPSLILAGAVWARAQAPAAPTLAYPADKGVNVATAVSLKWKTLAGATGYEAQLDTSAAFTAPLQDDSTLTDTLYHLSHLLDTTTYYWRVRAKNASGFGAYSKARSFTTTPPLGAGPTIVSPEAAAMDLPLTPTLKWNAFPGATTYGVQISLASNFSSLLFTDTSIADTAYKVTGAALAKGTLYYWHVRANTSPVKTAWTKGSFTTVADPPTAAAVLTAPEDGAVGQPIAAYLSWEGVERATAYVYQLSTQADFSAGVLGDSVPYPYVSAEGLAANTTYYWRVKGVSATGQAPFSAVRHFKTVDGTSGIRSGSEKGFSLGAVPSAGRGLDVEFGLPAAARVRIVCYGPQGGKAELLADAGFEAGLHRIPGPAAKGGAGIRFLELRAGNAKLVRRILAP